MKKRSDLTRRALLGAAATASVAPLFIPASALGKAGRPAPSERITLASIGVGAMGRGNTMSFLNNADCQVVAVCDVDRAHARDVRDGKATYGREPVRAEIDAHYAQDKADGRYKGCDVYADFREVIARDDIDAILVATPDHWHALITIAALDAGKDVYCQKPLTHTFAEGREVVAAAKRNDAIFQTGSQQRSTFNFRWAVELVLNGHIGAVRRVEVGLPTGHGEPPHAEEQDVPDRLDYDMWCGPSKKLPYMFERLHRNWRWRLDYGGGQLMDWIGHHNDIAHWGLGMDKSGPVEVKAVGFEYPLDTSVWNAAYNYEVKCRYASGVTSSISNKNRQGCKWIGDDGWVFVDRGKYEASNPEWTKNRFDRGPIKAYESKEHHRNFLDGVKTRTACICPAETGHRSVTPGHLGLLSAALDGRTLKWDPKDEQIVGDDAANKMLQNTPMREPWKLPA
ncbi:MAG: gfo/Idh/MocA family oxidoreductase [Phycisphaera sp.]|nr:gfo/Idh/MocA family oxidoreductase [Phycisphaera sp.]